MSIRDLLKNRDIINSKLKGDEADVTRDYVLRRARVMIRKLPDAEDANKPGDLNAVGTRVLAVELAAELPKARKAHADILARVVADANKGLHVPLSTPSLRTRVTGKPPADSAGAMRKRIVLSVVYQAAAADLTLLEPANLEKLHRLCDRRLRLVERMLYDVGRAPQRSWTAAKLAGRAAGPWTDGLDRMFEYPRVSQHLFLGLCAPGTDRKCQGPMTNWELGDDGTIVGPPQTNPATTARWQAGGADLYPLKYTPASATQVQAVAAINGLFTRSKDYRARNLMYCDQVIHALHLEALVFAESKRTSGGNTGWLDAVVAAKPSGWLQLSSPLPSIGALNLGQYLAGRSEPAFFEHTSVAPPDLQVGDHLIVYNHPAYEFATAHGAWRLENAVVVQTVPELLIQGHGSYILTIDGAKREMLTLFRAALDRCRAAVGALAKVVGSGTEMNTMKVDTVRELAVGMVIDIIEAGTEMALAKRRTITRIEQAGKLVTYDGARLFPTTKHVLRHPRKPQFNDTYEGVELSFGKNADVFLIRRVSQAQSKFGRGARDGDWHVAWVLPTDDQAGGRAVLNNPDLLKHLKDAHFVDLTVEKTRRGDRVVGWFPLYTPATKGGRPVVKDGKFVGIQPTPIGPRNIAAWTWFAARDPDATRVPVLRPKV